MLYVLALLIGVVAGLHAMTAPAAVSIAATAGRLRIMNGGFYGAAIATVGGSRVGGAVAGVIGAVIGTFGGYEIRKRLAAMLGGKDLPVALLEDLVAILLAFWMVSS